METSEHVEKLRDVLNQHFGWNKARITCFTKMIIGLFLSRTVNLTEIAAAFEGKAKLLSRYRRLQRFFSGFEIDYEVIAKFIFKLFDFKNIYLTMDRTNWKWGKANINILMLGVVYKGIAIPIAWSLLEDKTGNSKTSERIELMQTFIGWFGKDCIAGLVADREFKGREWFAWLIREDINFYIRIPNNSITTNSRGLEVEIDALFYDIKINEKRILKGQRKLWGCKVYLIATRSTRDNKLAIIATNADADQGLKIYCKRWQIETLFGCLKSRGFNFEDTHITDLVRIKKMIALLAIAFCWAHKTGEWRHEEEPITIKTHGRPAYSLFRYGLDYIRESFYQVACRVELFFDCLSCLNLGSGNRV